MRQPPSEQARAAGRRAPRWRTAPRRLWCGALLSMLCVARPGAASGTETESTLLPSTLPGFDEAQTSWQSSLSRDPYRRFLWPSVALERGSSYLDGPRALDELRLGLALEYRNPYVSPHLRLLLSPNVVNYQNVAATAGLGGRTYFDLFGHPLSLGVGAHFETRLRDSIWLTYATPLELGTLVYRGKSAEFFAYLGLRRAVYGELINSYLLDPNGFDNENSADRLDRLWKEYPWQVYIAFNFGRRLYP